MAEDNDDEDSDDEDCNSHTEDETGNESDESYDESEGQLSGSDDEEKQHYSMAIDNDDEDSDDEDCNSHTEDETPAKNQGKTQKRRGWCDDKLWNDKLKELHEYKRNFGDCLVPFKFPSNRGLERWVNQQRTEYKYFQDGQSSQMTSEKTRLLERVGFVWNVDTCNWKRKLQELEVFFAILGHTNVPERGNRILAQWIRRQRLYYKKYLNKEKTHMDAKKVLLLRKAGLQLE
eukprot:scaffold1014_cov274-Chaetoceros_neogracile.AAC.16